MARTEDILTPAQCRAGRALVDMNQQTLADLCELSRLSINKFEGGMPLKQKHLIAIRAALEVEGVVFIGEGRYGRGVRLRERKDARQPKLTPGQ